MDHKFDDNVNGRQKDRRLDQYGQLFKEIHRFLRERFGAPYDD
jgi:hypothetical protein